MLQIPEDDFSFQVPLTAYGIDSISAGRLAFVLRPYVGVSQFNLLSGVCYDDLLKLVPSQGAGDDKETGEK